MGRKPKQHRIMGPYRNGNGWRARDINAAALGHGDKGQTATRHYVGVTEQTPELKLYKTGTDDVAKTR
jgi:hypothetical protein